MAEYAIWGVPPGKTEEDLLVALPKGRPITDRAEADRLAEVCKRKGAINVRVQTIDGITLPNFPLTLNPQPLE